MRKTVTRNVTIALVVIITGVIILFGWLRSGSEEHEHGRRHEDHHANE